MGFNRTNGRGQGLPAPSPVINQGRAAGSTRAGYNPTITATDEKPSIRYGGLQTYETPIRGWQGDIVIGASVQFQVPIPDRTVTLNIISVVGTVMASINGGGFRSIIGNNFFSNTEIDSVLIITGAASSCIVQTGNL